MSIDQDWTRQRNPNKGHLGIAMSYLRLVIVADSTLEHEREELSKAFYIILEVQKEWKMNNNASKKQYRKWQRIVEARQTEKVSSSIFHHRG